MKIHLHKKDQRKQKSNGKNSGLVDSGFVKTCDDLVIGPGRLSCSQNTYFAFAYPQAQIVQFCTGLIPT